MKKNYLLLLIAVVLTIANSFGQKKVWKKWEANAALQTNIYPVRTKLDASNNLYSVGTTLNTGTGHYELFANKYNSSGVSQWGFTYGSGTFSTATALYVNDSGVFITGIRVGTGDTTSDIIVIRLDKNTGSEKWHYIWGGSAGRNDSGGDIIVNDTATVFVCGGSFNATDCDEVVLAISHNGSLLWDDVHDEGMNEVAYKMTLIPPNPFVTPTAGVSHPDLFIAGISQSTDTINYYFNEMGYYSYNGTIGSLPVGIASTGINQVKGVCSDAAGNIYVCGASPDNGMDMSIIKLDTALQVVWTQSFGSFYADVATSIARDAATGTIFVTGYTTDATTGKDFTTLAYDSTGALLWSKIYNDSLNNDDVATALAVKNDGVYVTGSANTDYFTVKYDATTGDEVWHIATDGNNGRDIPSEIKVDEFGNVLVSGQVESGVNTNSFSYKTIQYIENTKVPDYSEITQVTDSASGSSYLQSAIIVKFDRAALKMDMIDERSLYCSQASTFISDTMIYRMGQKIFDNTNADINKNFMANTVVKKIFKGMSSADSLTMTRSGEIIRVPDFWTTLLIFFDERIDERKAIDSLRSLFPYIIYAHPDFILHVQSPPNDSLLGEQASLIPNGTYANGNINVQPAWDIWDTSLTQTSVKIGVYDTGIDSLHADLNVFRRIDYTDLPAGFPDPIGEHGTAVAGIIGAKRNNIRGVAGIAGSTGTATDTILKIYDCDIGRDDGIDLTHAVEGLIFGASNIYYSHPFGTEGQGPYQGLGLNVMNNSWGGVIQGPDRDLIHEDSLLGWGSVLQQCLLCHEAVAYTFKNGCAIVAARGNAYASQDTLTSIFPACEKDEFVISVGACGFDGQWKQVTNTIAGDADYYLSMEGKDMDLIAPGNKTTVRTTRRQFGSPTDTLYRDFSGTSAAAPHVTGIVALMMSIVNSPCPSDKNLSPEDVENVLQISTTDVGTPGYESRSGWGRLNAGKALKMVQQPKYQIIHVKDTTPTYTSTLIYPDTVVRLLSPYTLPNEGWPYSGFYGSLDTGLYDAQVYKVTKRIYCTQDLVNVHPGSSMQVLGIWPRNSSSIGWSLSVCDSSWGSPGGAFWVGHPLDVSTNLEMDTSVAQFNSNGNAYMDISAYTYNILNKRNDTVPINIYYPCTQSQLRFNYSIFVHDSNATTWSTYPCDTTLSVHNISPVNAEMQITSVYPNPSTEMITVEYNLDANDVATINVINILGQKMFSTPVVSKNKAIYKTTIDVSNYSHGVYFVTLNSKVKVSQKKFVIVK